MCIHVYDAFSGCNNKSYTMRVARTHLFDLHQVFAKPAYPQFTVVPQSMFSGVSYQNSMKHKNTLPLCTYSHLICIISPAQTPNHRLRCPSQTAARLRSRLDAQICTPKRRSGQDELNHPCEPIIISPSAEGRGNRVAADAHHQ